MIETNVHLTETERFDFEYVLTSLNSTMEFVTRPLPIDTPIEVVSEYYDGVMARFKEAKVSEHILRCRYAKKYDIPYDFLYREGDILIAEDSDTTQNQ